MVPQKKQASAEKARLTVAPPGEGLSLAVAGGRYTIKASGEDNGGLYALIEMVIPPGAGPLPHTHNRELEAFYILEGEIAIQIGGQSLTAGTGAFIQAPPGIPHAFQNQGTIPARVLLLVVPAGLEKFFQEIGHPVKDKPIPPLPPTTTDLERVTKAAAKYDIEIHKVF